MADAAASPIAVSILAPFSPEGLARDFHEELSDVGRYDVPRGFGSGAPFFPPKVYTCQSQEAARAIYLLMGAVTLDQGVTMRRTTFGHLAIAHALGTVAISNAGRLPYVEADPKTGTGGIAIVQPWHAGDHKLDDHAARVLRLARRTCRILARAANITADPAADVLYLRDITDKLDTIEPPALVLPGPAGAAGAALPALAPILFTVACVGAIGISQWFRADVTKAEIAAATEKVYIQNRTARFLSATLASLKLEMQRQRLQAETGKPMEPSPLAVKTADAIETAIKDEPSGYGGALRIVGGLVGGTVLGGLAGWYAKKHLQPRG